MECYLLVVSPGCAARAVIYRVVAGSLQRGPLIIWLLSRPRETKPGVNMWGDIATYNKPGVYMWGDIATYNKPGVNMWGDIATYNLPTR